MIHLPNPSLIMGAVIFCTLLKLNGTCIHAFDSKDHSPHIGPFKYS